LGDVIIAREFPVGVAWVELEVPREVSISEYWPAAPQLRRIRFPAGRYRCAKELCSWPNHQQSGPSPHYLHWALVLYKVEILGSSDEEGPAPPAQRFCPYCGTAKGLAHVEGCSRYVPAPQEATSPQKPARGRPAKGRR
jgi:hypothetical protein